MKKRKYIDLFSDWSEVKRNFSRDVPEIEPKYVYASYTETSDYSWDAFVVIGNNKRDFQVVEGGHCSCYGLEGQWEPTDMGFKALVKAYRHNKDFMEWLSQL